MELSPELLARFERLSAAAIQLLPVVDLPNYYVFERDGFVALVERRGEKFGSIGSAGILADAGFAPLIHRDGAFLFVAKGFQQAATDKEVASLRSFQADLQQALL